VQLIRRGLSDLAIFKELTVPLTLFTVDSADESEMKLYNTRVQHHHLFGLFKTPSQIDLDKYIVDDYIISDPTTTKSSETGNSERDFLTYLLDRSESDYNLRCKLFWLLRSSAISSCVKHRSNQDFKTGKRSVIDGSYYLIEALITFAGRLILTRIEEDETSQCHDDSASSPSLVQQKETESDVLESLTVLFEPLAATIRSHDDLAALWAILLNNTNANGGTRHACTAVAPGSSGSPAIINTLHHPDELLPADTEEAFTRCMKVTATRGDSLLGALKVDGEGVDEDTAGAVDPWRDVTPPCSLLKASTVLLLCGGLPENENDHDYDHRCSNQLLLSRLDFARPFLSARQQITLDDALTRPPERNRHMELSLDSEPRDDIKPPLCSPSLSAGLASFTSQCRLINAVWVATEGLRSGFSLPESCERRNERFRESLQSSIGPGFFLPSSGTAELKISDRDPRTLPPSRMVSGKYSDAAAHAAEETSSRSQVNNLEKEKVNEMEKDEVLVLKANLPPLELRADQPDPQSGTGMTLDHPFWPLPSPLHSTSVLLTGLDISKVRTRCHYPLISIHFHYEESPVKHRPEYLQFYMDY
jgi:hypothetical protein